MRELISILVPTYNVSKFIDKCFQSIEDQTYDNFEVVIIDDGSTDGTENICDEWVKKDSRFRVIHKVNEGVSVARNLAIKEAKGRYIIFIDSDDMVEKTYLEVLFNNLVEHDADISCCGMMLMSEDYELLRMYKNTDTVTKVWETEDALKQMFYGKYFSNALWGKLYKSELFKDIDMPAGKLFEDMAVMWRIILNSKKLVYCSDRQYYYMKRKDSAMNTSTAFRKLDVIDAEDEIIDYLNRVNSPCLKAAVYKRACSSIVCLSEFDLTKEDGNNKEIIDRLWNNIKGNRLRMILMTSGKTKFRTLGIVSLAGKKTLVNVYRKIVR